MTQLQSNNTKCKEHEEKNVQCEEVISEALAGVSNESRRIPEIKVYVTCQRKNFFGIFIPAVLSMIVIGSVAMAIFRNNQVRSHTVNNYESDDIKINLETCMDISKVQTQQLIENYKTINDLENTVNTLNGSSEDDITSYTDEILKLKGIIEEKNADLQKKDDDIAELHKTFLNIGVENTENETIQIKIMEILLNQQMEENEKLKNQIKEKEEAAIQKDKKIKILSDEITDISIRKVTDIVMQNSNEYENCTSIIEEYSRNITSMNNLLEVLKNEFPIVKIRMYLNDMNTYDENRTYPCKLSLFHNRYSREDLARHLMTEHSYSAFVSEGASREVLGLPLFGTLDSFYLLTYGELFYVQVYVSPYNDLSFSVMLFGPDELATDFMYEIDILTDNVHNFKPFANCTAYKEPGYEYNLKINKAPATSFFFGKVKYSVRILRN